MREANLKDEKTFTGENFVRIKSICTVCSQQ